MRAVCFGLKEERTERETERAEPAQIQGRGFQNHWPISRTAGRRADTENRQLFLKKVNVMVLERSSLFENR